MSSRRLILLLPILLLLMGVVCMPPEHDHGPGRPHGEHPESAAPPSAIDEKDAADPKPGPVKSTEDPAVPATGKFVRVQGRILLPDGRPAAGARVYLGSEYCSYPPIRHANPILAWRSPRSEPVTIPAPVIADEDGRYSFSPVVAVSLPVPLDRISASHRGMYVIATIEEETAWPITMPDLHLAKGVSIRGRVVDVAGDPVPGVEAWVEVPGREFEANLIALSNARGGLVFHTIPEPERGTLRLFLIHEAHPPTEVEFDPRGDPFEAVLPTGFTLQGTVTDPAGVPRPGVQVEPFALDVVWPQWGLDRRVVVTDEGGRFRISGLPTMRVCLTLFTTPRTRSESVPPPLLLPHVSAPFTGTAGRVVATGPIRIHPPGEVRGRVIGENGNPYPNRKIHLETAVAGSFWCIAFQSTTTDAQGVFGFENVPPGDYRLVRRENSGIRTNKYEHGELTVRSGRTSRAEVIFPGHP